jgi:hypothetical protein
VFAPEKTKRPVLATASCPVAPMLSAPLPLIVPLLVNVESDSLDHVWSAPSATFAETVCAAVPACTVTPPRPIVSAFAPPMLTGAFAPLAKLMLRTARFAPSVMVAPPLLK